MGRGRPPKPSAQKRLDGNPGKRAVNHKEPMPTEGEPELPSHLDAEASAEWHRLIPELTALGVITIVDKGVLASYCMAWSRWVKAELMIQKSSEVLQSDSGGLYQNPYLAVANRAMEQMRTFGAAMGLDPSSRSRLQIERGSKMSEVEERFLKIHA